MKCPEHHSACSYGGCIHRTKKCNGFQDCKDGSDEDPKVCEVWSKHMLKMKMLTTTPDPDYTDDLPSLIEDYSEESFDEPLISSTIDPLLQNGSFIFTCISGQIVDETAVCDGINDCRDGSDETIAQCIGIRCPGYLFQCAYGGCIEEAKKCNGEEDCKDGSDETVDVCRAERPAVVLTHCPPLQSNTVDVYCSLAGREVNCSDPARISTKAEARCKPAYHRAEGDTGYKEATCLLGGKWSHTLLNCDPDCGVRIDARPLLWHSQEVGLNEFPWHAGLYKENGKRYICGASIITVKAVITAAHCVDSYKTINDYTVAVGKTWRDWDLEEPHEQKFKVSEFVLPRGFKGSNSLWGEDVAILALEKRIQITPTVMPICFDPEIYNTINPPKHGTVVGWGLTENGELSGRLRVMRLPIQTADECEYRVRSDFKRYITRDKFCGGVRGIKNGPRIDEGDSGGSLSIVKNENGREAYFLAGIVSITNKQDGTITLFTNVTEHYSWIRNVLSAIGKNRI